MAKKRQTIKRKSWKRNDQRVSQRNVPRPEVAPSLAVSLRVTVAAAVTVPQRAKVDRRVAVVPRAEVHSAPRVLQRAQADQRVVVVPRVAVTASPRVALVTPQRSRSDQSHAVDHVRARVHAHALTRVTPTPSNKTRQDPNQVRHILFYFNLIF